MRVGVRSVVDRSHKEQSSGASVDLKCVLFEAGGSWYVEREGVGAYVVPSRRNA